MHPKNVDDLIVTDEELESTWSALVWFMNSQAECIVGKTERLKAETKGLKAETKGLKAETKGLKAETKRLKAELASRKKEKRRISRK